MGILIKQKQGKNHKHKKKIDKKVKSTLCHVLVISNITCEGTQYVTLTGATLK